MVLICVLLSVFALSAGVFADESVPTAWNGSVDTSWYNADKTEFEISTPEQLAGVAAIANGTAEGIAKNNFTGKTVTLTADLDLGAVKKADGTWDTEKSKNWVPIGKFGSNFNGTFESNGHTITNMYMDYTVNVVGLFGLVSSEGSVKHVIVKDGFIEHGKANVGANAGSCSSGIIDSCANLNVEVHGDSYNIGGLVGSASAGSQSTTQQSIYGNYELRNCFANCIVQGNTIAGGLIGVSNILHTGWIHNNYTASTVSASGGTKVGGFAGDTGSDGISTKPLNQHFENNVVLVEGLNGVMTEGYFPGRFAGIKNNAEKDITTKFRNNYVLDSMTIFGSAFDGKDGDNYNGTGRSKADLAKESTWQELSFDFSETGSWTWNTSLNRPVLKDITAIYEIVIKENPLNGTAYANRPATFYADAMNGVGTLLYQWQRSDDNGKTWKNVLIGGNEKKLELNARYSWNGNLVRCMVTDNGGNVTYTKSALLNVVDMDFNANVAASV